MRITIHNTFLILLVFLSVLFCLLLLINNNNNNSYTEKRFLGSKDVLFKFDKFNELLLDNSLDKHVGLIKLCNRPNYYQCPSIKSSLHYKYKNLLRYDYNVSINFNTKMESNIECVKGISLVVGIFTTPEEFITRYAYRRILNEHSYVQFYFLMTKSKLKNVNDEVMKENIKYNDIIQFDMDNSYYNTPFHFINGMKWINNHCSDFKYAVYLKSDVYLNVTYYYEHYANINTKPILLMKRIITDNEKVTSATNDACIFFSKDSLNSIIKSSENIESIEDKNDIFISKLMNDANLSDKQYTINKEVTITSLTYDTIQENKLWISGLYPDLLYYIHLKTNGYYYHKSYQNTFKFN